MHDRPSEFTSSVADPVPCRRNETYSFGLLAGTKENKVAQFIDHFCGTMGQGFVSRRATVLFNGFRTTA
jgi:hypothetical protein